MAESIREQATAITQINDSVSNLENATQQNVAVAHDAHTIAQQVSEISENILKTVHKKII